MKAAVYFSVDDHAIAGLWVFGYGWLVGGASTAKTIVVEFEIDAPEGVEKAVAGRKPGRLLPVRRG